MKSKFCKRCGTLKLVTEFHKHKNRPDGLTGWCKPCAQTYSKEHYKRNKKVVSQKNRQWRVKNKQRLKDYDRLRKYGLTKTKYCELLDTQGGKCAICKTEFSEKAPQVDHDHKTEKVRGLLCARCNTVVGIIETFPDITQVYMYLRNRK